MKFNHISKEIIIQEEKDECGSKADFRDLFRTPMIRRNTIVISLAWFALGTLYFGLSLHMPEFKANIYLIFFLSGLVEIPADICVWKYHIHCRLGHYSSSRDKQEKA